MFLISSAKVLLQRSGQCEGLATLVLTKPKSIMSEPDTRAPLGGLCGRVDGQVSPAYHSYAYVAHLAAGLVGR